jgi:ribosomal protein L40E
MPRGGGGGSRGGGFRGGGFRGGFSGGAFRGGGFRGGSTGFRMGTTRPSGRPFGRTGATRTVTRSPSGPYRHSYYRPYGYYYRPWWWYRRPFYYRWWWYSHWWAGYYYRPWYYSPMYIGGGIVFAIIFILILLPLAGVALAFPFSNADVSGNVNYRSTETLYFNEFWYEYEYIESSNDITYSIDSSIANINFAIWDQPFENLPLVTLYDNEVGPITLTNNEYQYLWMFLRPGSLIEYDFSASAQIDFFIADGYDLYLWNQGGSPSFELNVENTIGDSGALPITIAKDYYVVWYNDGGSSVNVDFTVDYTITDVVDFTAANRYVIDTDYTSGTFTVPSSGNWYFFIYFDPMNSIEESTTITFDVTYDTGVTSTQRWVDIQPILITILIIVGILIIVALVARRGQKKIKSLPTKEPSKPSAPGIEVKEKKEEKLKCVRCGATHSPDAEFCPQCGGKIDGRQLGTTNVTTPVGAKTCTFCGSALSEKDNYCKWCGTRVENK